jgi:outer membrane protein TolC
MRYRSHISVLLCSLSVLGASFAAASENAPILLQNTLPAELPEATEESWSIDQCVFRALDVNYDILIRDWSITSAAARVMSARSSFEPSISAYAGRQHSSETNFSSETDSGQVRLNTRFVTGTEIDLYARYSTSDDDDDEGTGRVGIDVSQPLLRGFGIKRNRAAMIIARNNLAVSQFEFTEQLLSTIRNVEQQYWLLVSARERLAVQQASMKSAKDLERLTLQRAEARIMSESDTVEAQAAVYDRESSVVRAAEYVRTIEDNLKEALSLLEVPAYWTCSLVPATQPKVQDHDIDFLTSLRTSLENRPDYQAALLRLKNLDLNLYVAKNNLLPQLNLTAGLERQEDDIEIGNTLKAVNGDDENWSVFLQLDIPLGNKDARAVRDRTYAETQQQLLRIRQLELKIIRQVRRAIDSLNTNRRLVEATRKAVEFEQKKLENEQVKLDLGKSTTDNVVRFIQSLNQARLNHVQSVIDYSLAWSHLEEIQGTSLNRYGVQRPYEN